MRTLKFISLWLILTFFFSLFNSSYDPSSVFIQGINSLLFTVGFYFSYHFLIKRLLYKGKTGKFVLLYLLVTTCLSIISMVTVYQVYVFTNKKFYVENYWKEPVFYTSNFVLILLVVSTLLSVRFLKDKMQMQLQLENLEKEKISTELNFLKAQINPHFLFNSLNNILFQIDKTNQSARETLLKFSEMLRYQLYECNSDRIEIEKEIHYIKNYMEIQMLRKTEKYNCNCTVSSSVKNFSIAPLVLIPFIENAFKHISNHSAKENSILMRMEYQKDVFMFSIINDRDHIAATSVNENKGIGLSNVKRRLHLLYPGKHLLEINDAEDKFGVVLKMQVN